jgi:hypothetical protein
LRNFLSLRISYVTTETVIVLKDILRKYRGFIDDFIPFFSKIALDQITEVEGKCAYVWILGEFGEDIDEISFEISCSYTEIYNEQIHDLLDPTQ